MHALDFASRLGAGLGCGALIGLERQWRARMAGLRTDALAATGATVPVIGPYGGLRTRIGLAVLAALTVIVAIAIWRRGRRG